MAVNIPARLVKACQKDAERLSWLNRLPEVLCDLQQRWSLTFEDAFEGAEGSCAWVAGVTLPDRAAAVLKLGMPHMEGEHEIEGLRFWSGDPTVQLLNADDRLGAMLLERCEPGTALREAPESEQDIVIAGLLRRLWRPPSIPHVFRPLSAMTAYWCTEALEQTEHWPDAGLISEGLVLFK
ncbi:MAG TPA: aminoglycoside phosphotransferase family protein, partial [Bryobacteraceae bacterium]|nr:aminoglycoside phosphotransferase family protein [Bryobacteraceae bacterium]